MSRENASESRLTAHGKASRRSAASAGMLAGMLPD
jgi:hypothetical protein